MSLSSSTLVRLRHASWMVVALVVGSFLVGVYRRTSRLDPAFVLVVVGFLVVNGGLVVLGAWAANRE